METNSLIVKALNIHHEDKCEKYNWEWMAQYDKIKFRNEM